MGASSRKIDLDFLLSSFPSHVSFFLLCGCLQVVLLVKNPPAFPGLGRSLGEGNGNPLQYSCLENPMDGGAWWATVHDVAESKTIEVI